MQFPEGYLAQAILVQRNSMYVFHISFQHLGVGKKNKVEFLPGTGNQEKIIWNFQGCWFLALEFPRDVAKICGISRGGALFCLEFPGAANL